MQQLQQTVDRPAQTVIIMADDMKKTPVGKIDNFLFTINGITISIKVLVMDAFQYQALVGNDWLLKANANLDWKTQELKISYQEQHTIVSAMCGTFNKQSEKAPILKFEEEKKMPLTETYMALGLTFNWAEEKNKKSLKNQEDGRKLDILYQNHENNHLTFHLNAEIVTKNFHQWEPAFYLKKNMKIILVITARLATENDGAI
ncbi:hypothetical protein G9A89_015869 [Geosiphon pyriformis]|nr:hypothetical protein G9A89_015869 [Geosiphon pyriformis]